MHRPRSSGRNLNLDTLVGIIRVKLPAGYSGNTLPPRLRVPILSSAADIAVPDIGSSGIADGVGNFPLGGLNPSGP